jgi:hypothetical protein
VAIGAATDPYQPAEGFYRLTRGCLQVLAEAANPFSIITRGPMVVRDIDVLVEAASRASVSVTFSVPTLDEKIWRLTEPNTPPPRQRLKALATLRAAGIEAGVGMAPILPGLSDKPELMADVVKAARDAGATSIWTNVLYLRPGTREHFLDHLARDWPQLLPMYERLYRGRAYLGKAELEPVRREVAELRHRFAVAEPAHAPRPPGAMARALASTSTNEAHAVGLEVRPDQRRSRPRERPAERSDGIRGVSGIRTGQLTLELSTDPPRGFGRPNNQQPRRRIGGAEVRPTFPRGQRSDLLGKPPELLLDAPQAGLDLRGNEGVHGRVMEKQIDPAA